ncbi:MAG: complex I NDUFA9 subunit family protein, partial [Rhodospirillales bacterium]
MQGRVVTVFGGSGFIGRYVIKRLAAKGARVRVATRDPEGAKFLKPMGAVGQVAPVKVSISQADSVKAAVDGSDAVINLIGILSQGGRQSFRMAHVEGPQTIARAAAAAGVRQMVHVSAIGASAESASAYARSKALGEDSVRSALPESVILRPSVVFGPEDDFFNRFGAMARIAPALPLIDGGRTKFQPVYVGDVADAVLAVLQSEEYSGKTYELGGPEVMNFRELLEYILSETGRKRALVPAPALFLKPLAALMELLPSPPLTRDQLILLQKDNVVDDKALKLSDLGIE